MPEEEVKLKKGKTRCEKGSVGRGQGTLFAVVDGT